MINQDFGLRLKELRKIHNFTQTELANNVGISRQTYLNYEYCRTIPPAETIVKLSQIFDVDLMEYFYNHTSRTYSENNKIISNPNRDDFFEIYDIFTKLSPLSQKRIINLLRLMAKGGGN
ncbi:MAG: helix-turn-helix transcriptional regulator [Lachnospiraceae bacterium]|nr:helix-turn-helix transcriptional regulator [Lachnospiraceae bacterium]